MNRFKVNILFSKVQPKHIDSFSQVLTFETSLNDNSNSINQYKYYHTFQVKRYLNSLNQSENFSRATLAILRASVLRFLPHVAEQLPRWHANKENKENFTLPSNDKLDWSPKCCETIDSFNMAALPVSWLVNGDNDVSFTIVSWLIGL